LDSTLDHAPHVAGSDIEATVKVVILAGGYGTRFGKATDFMPKPMIPVGPFPIVWHIMRYYSHFGFNEFILCTGYKSELIKEYFCNLDIYGNDVTLDFGNGSDSIRTVHSDQNEFRPRITLAYTGQDTMTGGRIKRIASYLDGDTEFMLTYGDGLTNVDIGELVSFHRCHGKLATLTAVHTPPRFGNLTFEDQRVVSFAEKEGQQGALVNGGFYVFNSKVLDYLDDDPGCILEKKPLESLANDGELMSFQHEGYWQCMDTTRDLESLQNAWAAGAAPWKVWTDGYCD